ncbi:unnamed protein product [Vicia faba]|uniref:RNase H type-1 domain-containing protein n=1 Tax=Vicia faba TaxID=3906 RepID=A0AAV0Z9M5_VICFA|nr:unnamed protein product [Vicia faba]
MCTLLWKIWNSRNLWHFQQKFKDPHNMALDAWDCVLEFYKQVPAAIRKCPKPRQECSFGQGFSSDPIGCMIKSWDSKVIYAACVKDFMSVDPATAEMLAIWWSLQNAKELQLEKTRVQSDALTVIDCINFIGTLVDLEFITSDIRSLLASFKIRYDMFLNRQFNVDSHNLVCLGKLCGARS